MCWRMFLILSLDVWDSVLKDSIFLLDLKEGNKSALGKEWEPEDGGPGDHCAGRQGMAKTHRVFMVQHVALCGCSSGVQTGERGDCG